MFGPCHYLWYDVLGRRISKDVKVGESNSPPPIAPVFSFFVALVGGCSPCVQVVKAAADETPLTLAVLRDYIEKELSEEASLAPEAAAKVR